MHAWSQVAGYMRWPWPLAKALLLVPPAVRDPAYDMLAARRYSWFGRSAHCQLPPAELLERFVDRDELLRGSCCDEAMEPSDEE